MNPHVDRARRHACSGDACSRRCARRIGACAVRAPACGRVPRRHQDLRRRPEGLHRDQGRQFRRRRQAGPRRVRRHPRALGLRQEHHSAHDRGAHPAASADQRHGARVRPADRRRRRGPRHGVPGLHQLRSPDGGRQRRLRPRMPRRAAGRAPRRGDAVDRESRPESGHRCDQISAPALRRHAPARGHRADADPEARASS